MQEDAIREERINYASLGEGEPFILIHGVGLDHTMWQYQLDYFSSFYKVYAYDMLGHGGSEKPLKKEYTLADFTNQLSDFMEMHQIESAHLLGFSMGGMVAQSFSIAFPEKVRTVTIANAVANRTEEENNSILQRVKLVEKEGKDATIGAAIERWFNADYIMSHPDTVERIKLRLETNDEKAYLNAYRVFATADRALWNKLPQIKAPALIITGEFDQGSNTRMAKQMKNKIPGAELQIVPGVRHMLPVEKFVHFNKSVHDFLHQHKEVNNN